MVFLLWRKDCPGLGLSQAKVSSLELHTIIHSYLLEHISTLSYAIALCPGEVLLSQTCRFNFNTLYFSMKKFLFIKMCRLMSCCRLPRGIISFSIEELLYLTDEKDLCEFCFCYAFILLNLRTTYLQNSWKYLHRGWRLPTDRNRTGQLKNVLPRCIFVQAIIPPEALA